MDVFDAADEPSRKTLLFRGGHAAEGDKKIEAPEVRWKKHPATLTSAKGASLAAKADVAELPGRSVNAEPEDSQFTRAGRGGVPLPLRKLAPRRPGIGQRKGEGAGSVGAR